MSGQPSQPTHPSPATHATPGAAADAPAAAAQTARQADERPAGGSAAHRPAGRRRGISRQSKIVLVGAAVALLAIAVITVATAGSKAAPPRTPPAAKAFTLSLLGHPGQHVSLAAYAGRPLIINFFASWCTPCQHETPLLARFYRDSGGRTLIVGIDANDEAGPAEKFVQSAGVSYPVAADPFPAPVTTSYGVFALPQTFFLNSRHRIVKHVIGAVTLAELKAGVAEMDARS
jgi:cytochrome c biogenesis protein CcmG, thiol:disulfide interchange protein DsbE